MDEKNDIMVEKIPYVETDHLQEKSIENIAVLRLGTLGDMILTTPLFTALRQFYPDAHITVIASEWNSLIPKHHNGVDEVIAIPSGLKGIIDWIGRLLLRKFDLYIDPKDHKSTTSRIIAELIRATTKLVVPGNLPMLSSAEIIPPPSDVGFTHSALAPMIVLAPDMEFSLRPSFQIPEPEFELSKLSEEPFILINISTGSPTRRWPESKWMEFVKAIEWDRKIVIISSPEDADSGIQIATAREEATYLPTKSLMEAAAIVAEATCLITSDTSIVHIAGALNRPIVALYFNAPNMMAKFAPLSETQHVLVAPDQQPVRVIEVSTLLDATHRLIADC